MGLLIAISLVYFVWIPISIIAIQVSYKKAKRVVPPNIRRPFKKGVVINNKRNKRREQLKRNRLKLIGWCLVPVLNILISIYSAEAFKKGRK